MITIAGIERRTKGRKQKEFFFTIPHPPSSSSSLWSLLPVSTAMRAPGQDFSLLQFPTTSGPILLSRAQPSTLSVWRLLELSTKPHSGVQKHPEYILSWFSHHWSPWILEHNSSTIWSSFYVVPNGLGNSPGSVEAAPSILSCAAHHDSNHKRPSEHLTSPILAVLWLPKDALYFEGTMKKRNVTISLLLLYWYLLVW